MMISLMYIWVTNWTAFWKEGSNIDQKLKNEKNLCHLNNTLCEVFRFRIGRE